MERTSDPYDVLYTEKEWFSCDMKQSITIEKGILDKKENGSINVGELTHYFDYYSYANNTEAKRLFEFFANNTHVEWGLISHGQKSNYLSTGHEDKMEPVQAKLLTKLKTHEKNVRDVIHSHPSQFTIFDRMTPFSGNPPSDTYLSGQVKHVWPNAKTSVYAGEKVGYVRFNENGAEYSREQWLIYLRPEPIFLSN